MQDNSAQTIEQLNGQLLLQNDKILILEQQNAELNARVKWYEEQYRLGRQKQFGASSEKTSPEQINLFNEAEDIADPETKEPDVTVKQARTYLNVNITRILHQQHFLPCYTVCGSAV